MTKEKTDLNVVDILFGLGLRNTASRRLIWKLAYDFEGHFTAEDFLAVVNKRDKRVSRSTVYRALPRLVQSGILREIDIGRAFKYYASTKSAGTFKGQILCDNCDKIIEFDAPFMEWYGKTIAEKNGLTFISQRLQVVAHCNKCP